MSAVTGAHSASNQNAAIHETHGHAPADVHADHTEHERPEDWGWHGETGKWGRIGAWISVVTLLAYLIGNHEGRVENVWIIGIAAVMVIMLLWDRQRRKNAWRSN
jgi:uncharacterized membrane protein YuzA (DUF378 family)